MTLQPNRFFKVPVTLLLLVFVILFKSTPAQAQDEQLPVLTAAEKRQQLQRKLQQLRFGQVLYQYFQQQPLKSLESIAIAEHYGVADSDKSQMQLMQGGASLQLGMTETATQLLTELLAQSQPKEVQAQAWYWLAKTAFQQGLYSISKQAREYIQDNELLALIEQEQWLELQYQSAYFSLQSNPDNWRNIINTIPQDSIWYPYLMANTGIQFFNQQDYKNASQLFVNAIDSAKVRPYDPSIVESVIEWSWWPWSEERGRIEDSPEYRERNTLLDRLYYSVGQTFVKQKNHTAAFNAFKQIQSDSLYAEQGLLAYGWALANEERWNEALPVWQHLRNQGKGLPSLQATHALAYGFEQLTDYARAYSMLTQSLSQLEQARQSLTSMQELKSQADFILRLAEQSELPVTWPSVHQDLILDLLSGDNQQNTAKQLQNLVQLNNIVRYIQGQQDNIGHLEKLLDERADSFANRAAAITIKDASALTQQYTSQLDSLTARVVEAPNNPANFASQLQLRQTQRLITSDERLKRLANEDAINAKQRETSQRRLARLQGVLSWQLNEQQIVQQYQHETAIKQATEQLQQVQNRLETLTRITSDPQQFRSALAGQYQRLFALREAFTEKLQTTQQLQDQLILSLQNYLLVRMQQRDAVLLEQITATKLAMLRMQDVSFSRQQQFRNKQ